MKGVEGGACSVVKKKSSVLVAGFDKGAFETLAPMLDRQDLEVARMASPKSSVELAQARPFDFIIFNADDGVGTLASIVDAIRDEKSASKKTSLLVMADSAGAEAASKLVGRGVNRVMLLDDSPELISQQVSALLNVAPRAATRFSVRLNTYVSDGNADVLCEVVNLSVSGMLVATDLPFEPEDEVVVSLYLGDEWGPVSTRAVVVRRAHKARGGIDGIGFRFVDLAVDDKTKIEDYLDKIFAEQLGG